MADDGDPPLEFLKRSTGAQRQPRACFISEVRDGCARSETRAESTYTAGFHATALLFFLGIFSVVFFVVF